MVDETQTNDLGQRPRVVTVGWLKAKLAAMEDDDALVIVDTGKASCSPVLLDPVIYTARELQDGRFRLGGDIKVCILRA